MKRDAEDIVRVLRREGHQAYLVGGCVRDMLMHKKPKDFDVATSARPEQVTALFNKTIPVGAQFGVIIVRKGHKNYEVATFREDLGYSDGRRPDQVRFSDARTDARRRDFTINGMFYDPIEKRVIDYVGGQTDLEKKIIRAIGDPEERFLEDKLRMMRAARFSARFGFPIHAKTVAAIKKHADKIKGVSAERVRDELTMILTEGGAGTGIKLLDELGLLSEILPEVTAMKGVEQPPEFHPEGDVFVHTMLMLKLMRPPLSKKIEFALAVLLHDVGKPKTFEIKDRIRFNNHDVAGADQAADILRRLRFSREIIETVDGLVREHMRFMNVTEMRASTLKRFLRRDDFDLHLELHRLDCLASHGDVSNYRFCKKTLREIAAEKQPLRPPRLLTGEDLIKLGYPPGPLFKQILTSLEDAQLEGKITSRDEAEQWVKENFSA